MLAIVRLKEKADKPDHNDIRHDEENGCSEETGLDDARTSINVV
jgi:hypothetical protein